MNIEPDLKTPFEHSLCNFHDEGGYSTTLSMSKVCRLGLKESIRDEDRARRAATVRVDRILRKTLKNGFFSARFERRKIARARFKDVDE
jgi:hypothetical protein